MNEILSCANCGTRVIPSATGECPACRKACTAVSSLRESDTVAAVETPASMSSLNAFGGVDGRVAPRPESAAQTQAPTKRFTVLDRLLILIGLAVYNGWIIALAQENRVNSANRLAMSLISMGMAVGLLLINRRVRRRTGKRSAGLFAGAVLFAFVGIGFGLGAFAEFQNEARAYRQFLDQQYMRY